MASNEGSTPSESAMPVLKGPKMREPQRLRIEQELATARRALYRALSVAESGAYYNVEDAIQVVNVQLAEIMDAVMHNRETTIQLPLTP